MARYEAVIDTHVEFYNEDPANSTRRPGQAIIEFDGDRFVWHPGTVAEDGERTCPTVSVVSDGDFGAAGLAVNRFLSALCFLLDESMPVVASSATGFKQEFDPPILGQPSVAWGVGLRRAPTAAVVADDPRLRLVLGVYRDGRAAGSPSTDSFRSTTP